MFINFGVFLKIYQKRFLGGDTKDIVNLIVIGVVLI